MSTELPAKGRGLRLRVASYNIHGCVGVDRRYAPNRIAAVLSAVAPDIVALQEVDNRRPHHEGLPQFKYFEQTTGLHAVPGISIQEPRGDYGNLLLTRFPVERIRPLDLSIPGREPRCAVDVDLATPSGPLRVVAVHLGLSRAERGHQFHRLIEALGDMSEPGGRALLLGDFNEWTPDSGSRMLALTAPFAAALTPRSFPAPAPLFRLDRIYATPVPAAFTPYLPETPLARYSSDHLPVAVDLRWD